MAGKILIVEDDTSINHMIKETLDREGFSCQQAFSGTEALIFARKVQYSAIVLDLMLPGLSGEEVIDHLKNLQDAPVLVLSAKDSLDSKLKLLQGGADDYMTKPFSLKELLARLNILIRSHTPTRPSTRLRHHDLVLDEENFQVMVCGQDLGLTQVEFKILSLLVNHPNRVFTKQDIFDQAWDDYYVGGDKTINVHISNIRKKIKALTDREYVETVWGVGFRLAP